MASAWVLTDVAATQYSGKATASMANPRNVNLTTLNHTVEILKQTPLLF